MLPSLPAEFAPTREALRTLACYAISPARKVRTGRIGLRPTGDGFGTPPFDDGSRIVVSGDHLQWDPRPAIRIETVRSAAAFLGIEPQPDPGVGHDVPPYDPDATLLVDPDASLALGAWYGLGQEALNRIRSELDAAVGEVQLWPEHFDLAVTIELDGNLKAGLGFSPGDRFHADPYVYVAPNDRDRLIDPYWNAPFGAYLGYAALAATHAAPVDAAVQFVRRGLSLLVNTTAGESSAS